MSAWSDMAATLWPGRDREDGPLPPLLLGLTVVTGLVDAASYLKLGHVFVANMTGNVVFLGFAIAGSSGLSVWTSLIALAAFLAGGLSGGRLADRLGQHRASLLRGALAVQLAGFVVAVVIAAAASDPQDRAVRYVLIAFLAFAMGIQNATARRLAVPELTTTVLTMTLTGIAADSTLAGGRGARTGRRLLSVAAMLLGALVGALLTLKVGIVEPLAAAAGVLAVIALLAHRFSGSRAAWATA